MTETDPTPSPATQPPAPSASEPAPPPWAASPPPPWWLTPPKKSFARRLFGKLFVLLFVLSVLMNVYLSFLIYISARGDMSARVLSHGDEKQIVAVYSVTGMIDAEAASDFGRFYRHVRDNDEIKAVVLRVSSGGGGVSASDRIYSMVKSIREKLHRPVVVSMGSMAASGGYYISAAANEIYAEPTTVTGSIGVIAMWPVITDMLNQHWGVEIVTIRSPQAEEWKAKANPFEKPDERTRGEVREMLRKIHLKFEQVVLSERENIQVAEADHAPLNGKVYLADDAITVGLVDKIGYLDDAANAAAKLVNLSKPRVVQYSRRMGLFEQLTASAPGPIIDAKTFDKLSSPRFMLLWKPQ